MWSTAVFVVLCVLFFRAMGRSGTPVGDRPVPRSWTEAAGRLAADVVRGARVLARLDAARRARLDQPPWAADPSAPGPSPRPLSRGSAR